MPDVRITFMDERSEGLKIRTGYGEDDDSVIEMPYGVRVFRKIRVTEDGKTRRITEITTYPWHRVKAVITSGPNL